MTEILIVDLLYSTGSSLIDDAVTIRSELSRKYQVNYIAFRKGDFLKALPKLYTDIIFSNIGKVVFTSYSLWHLYFLFPLRIFCSLYAIYHFVPRRRALFHQISLRIFKHIIKIATYSPAVSDRIYDLAGFRPNCVPPRIIDEQNFQKKFREKISAQDINILVPGIRTGIRRSVPLKPIVNIIEDRLGLIVSSISIQGPMNVDESLIPKCKFHEYLERYEYQALFEKALFVVISFDPEYEVRASGILFDAINSGCLVIADTHPILEQYGFPNAWSCALDSIQIHSKRLVEKSEIYSTDFRYFSNEASFIEKWENFIDT